MPDTANTRLPTYAISHGGGPWPWLGDEFPGGSEALRGALASIPAELPRPPQAILMITAHWEAPAFTVGAHPSPGMIYDYGGFPPETYQVSYPAPGDPEIAARVADLLSSADLPTATDSERGFDHGTFVPAYVMYPDADTPVVQLSVQQSFNPDLHLAAGRALAPLRDDGVLIVGSGLPSYHNLSAMGTGGGAESRQFDAWLTDTLLNTHGTERSQRLSEWATAPAARAAHPREEHFLPLLVAVGAAEDDEATRPYHEDAMFGHIASSGYRLGAEPHTTTPNSRSNSS